jgi:Fic family protein
MANYIHERKDWPRFSWSRKRLIDRLAAVRHRQGRLLGRMDALGPSARNEAVLGALTDDVVSSADMDGVKLDREQVRAALARRLGPADGAPCDSHVEGAIGLALDAAGNFTLPLNEPRLFAWHAGLFPAAPGETAWRDDMLGPMRIVSGQPERERVHYEAPPARKLPKEVRSFLAWFDDGDETPDPVLKAGVAYLWFAALHPFDDGNGRIARAIADLALARSEQSAQRCYSLSAQLLADQADYYEILDATLRGDLDLTPWLDWFLGCLDRSFGTAEQRLADTIRKTRLPEMAAGPAFNTRQRTMLERLRDGFEGRLTSSRWAELAGCSQDTALRDIDDLIRHGLLTKDTGGGRSTSYSPATDKPVNSR